MDSPPKVSFEFFPPASEAMEKKLYDSVERLSPLGPDFVSVTYGADGSTRERTHRVVEWIVAHTDLTCAPHLTCVGASRDEVLDIAREYSTPKSKEFINGILDNLTNELKEKGLILKEGRGLKES